ncbi:oligosaccharide flippase family protein [Cuniculiplasma sp. SKW3]|uniref:oligosaccharide flippase family protein n=1 Tax=Cuniculiplasma sp. SKW3 TaxID=3400170 RepID=UPI003FD4DC1D
MFSEKSPIIVIQTVVSSFIGYVALFFINRYVGPVYWGYLSYAIAFGGLFTLITDLGFSSANVKFITQENERTKNLSAFLFIKIVLSILFVCLTVGALLFWVYVLHKGFENPIEFWTIIGILPYYAIYNLISVPNSFYQANIDSKNIAIPRLIESVIRNGIFIMIGVVYFFNLEGNIGVGISVILALIYGLSYSVYLAVAMNRGRPWHFQRPDFKTIRKYAVFAAPLAFSSSIATINGNIDKIIIQFFYGALATGAFYTDQRLLIIVTSLTGSVSIFILPLLSSKIKLSNLEFDASVIEYERIVSLITLPFVLIFFWLSPYILNIYSKAYLGYYAALSVLAVGSYISAIQYPFLQALISKDGQSKIAKISTMGIIINIILNVIFIPPYLFGIKLLGLSDLGAALGYTISSLVTYLLFKHIYRLHNKEWKGSVLHKHIIIIVPVSLILLLGDMYIKPYPFVLLMPLIVVSLLMYLGISILMKEITMEQVITIIRGVLGLKQ